ncbi:hypothetical protein BD309DRAFT_481235 [Dichomitus squalens]|nr:hypothetical protein BD309DRAFT_481235 [Dichomitus squalens]
MLAVFLVTAVGPADMGTYTAISIVASKLYANSLLAALNSRQSLKGRAEAHTVGTEIFGTEVGRQEHKLASAPVSLELRVNSGSNRFTATTVNTSRKAANGDQLGNQDTHVEGFKAPNTQRDLVHIC